MRVLEVDDVCLPPVPDSSSPARVWPSSGTVGLRLFVYENEFSFPLPIPIKNITTQVSNLYLINQVHLLILFL